MRIVLKRLASARNVPIYAAINIIACTDWGINEEIKHVQTFTSIVPKHKIDKLEAWRFQNAMYKGYAYSLSHWCCLSRCVIGIVMEENAEISYCLNISRVIWDANA